MQEASGALVGVGHHNCCMLTRDVAIQDSSIIHTYSLTPCGFQNRGRSISRHPKVLIMHTKLYQTGANTFVD